MKFAFTSSGRVNVTSVLAIALPSVSATVAVSVVRSLLSAITGSFEAASVISAFATFGT